MEIIGKSTINPFVFYSGKTSGYIVWIVFFVTISGVRIFETQVPVGIKLVAYSILAIGIVFEIYSGINLGKSTRLGIPSGETVLKTKGIYKISRNPMYVGFNLITIAAMVYVRHPVVIVLGLYSIFTYHLIIRGEERFLNERFGEEYRVYKKKVRRYF